MIISIILKEEDCLSFFGSTFPEVKAAGKLPLGQLPVLEVLVAIVGIIDNHHHDGHHDQHHEPSQHDDDHRQKVDGHLIAQSGAINRYLASLVPSLLPGFNPLCCLFPPRSWKQTLDIIIKSGTHRGPFKASPR